MESKPHRPEEEDREAVAGAVSGATGAGVGAGIGLAAFGPVGALVGALAGAVGGWWSGTRMHHEIERIDEQDAAFQTIHADREDHRPFDEVRHAYQYGYLAGRDPDASASFDTVEPDLRAAWDLAHSRDASAPSWDDVRAAVRAGYGQAGRGE